MSHNRESDPTASTPAEEALSDRITAASRRNVTAYALYHLAFGDAADQATLARALDAAEKYAAQLDAARAALSTTGSAR